MERSRIVTFIGCCCLMYIARDRAPWLAAGPGGYSGGPYSQVPSSGLGPPAGTWQPGGAGQPAYNGGFGQL